MRNFNLSGNYSNLTTETAVKQLSLTTETVDRTKPTKEHDWAQTQKDFKKRSVPQF